MRIFYLYEFEGKEKTIQRHFINVEDEYLAHGLSYDALISFLEREKAMINDASVISYFNKDKEAYMTLKRDEIIPLSAEIKILIRRGHSKKINDLLQKIESLQQQVNHLEAKLEHREKENLEKPKPNKIPSNLPYFEIDIAVLHAAPLVYQLDLEFVAYDEAQLEFESQKQYLLENLKKCADIRFEAATPENFDELLEYMPKIIIIFSQGYSKSGNEFVLSFEKHDSTGDGKGEIGLLYELSAGNLKKMLMASNRYKPVVVIKGKCSQEMGNTLIDAGFGCVVAVHEKEDDQESMNFIVEFSNKLLLGETIEDAYKFATKASKKANQCCCAHKHAISCLWINQCEISALENSHNEHSLNTCCELEDGSHFLHCTQANLFNEKYNPQRVMTEKELEEGKWKICCCRSEAHLTNQQFAILCNDQGILSQPILELNKKTRLEVRSALSAYLKPPKIEKFTAGRRLEIREILLKTLSNRCVNIVGACGIGKTMTIKRAAHYAYERRIFKDGVVYLDFLMRTDILFLNRYIANTLNLPTFKTNEDLCTAISDLDVLLIIDNIDPLLKQDYSTVIDLYKYILSNTSKPTFLIASQKALELKESVIYQLPSLTKGQAVQLLRHLNKLNGVSHIQVPPHLFDFIGTMPADILQISPLLFQGNYHQFIGSEEISSVAISLAYIKTKFPQAQDFLKLLSYFPSGAFKLNIKYLCEKSIPSYQEILLMLKHEGKATGTWFIHSDKDFEFVLLRSNVASYFESEIPDSTEMVINSLTHLALFSRGILRALLTSGSSIGAKIRSSMFFVNAGIDHGMWKSQLIENQLPYAEITNATAMFTKVEANFWNYLNVKQLKKLFNSEDTLPDSASGSLGEIMLCTTGIFILLGKTDDAMEMITRGRCCCKVFKMRKVKNMLGITEASLKARAKDYSSALEIVEKCKQFFVDENDIEGQAECQLLKALIKDAIQSKNELILLRKNTNCVDIEGELGQVKLLFSRIMENVGYARAQLTYAEFMLKHDKNEKELYNSLMEAIDIFSKFGYDYWEIRAKICLSDLYYHGHNFVEARKELLSIVFKRKNVKHEIIIGTKLRQINNMILSTKKYVIALFKSFAIVEKTQNGQIIRAGSLWRHSSKFRQDMLSVLKDSNKEICVRMDIASRKNICDYLLEKCLILHISSDILSSTHIILEGERGLADRLTFHEFSDLVGGNLHQHGVELVVLALPLSVQFGEFCHEKLGVKHVVCFNFLDYPQDGEPVQISMIIQDAIIAFSLEFYKNLVSGDTVREAFSKAKSVMEDYITSKVYEFPLMQIRGKTFLSWWDEYHKNEPVLINEFSPDHDDYLISSDTSEGSFIEMNNPRGPCNITRDFLKPHSGRQIEFYNTLSALKDFRCLHIIGDEGSGKTEFVSQIGYFLNGRNKYPDGIFLLNLEGKSSLPEVYALLQEVGLAFYSSDIVPSSFLYNREMLLILDNCDELYSRAAHTFNSLLSMFLNDCKISLIITSSIKIQTSESHNVKRFALRKLSNLESQVMLSLNAPFTAQTESEQAIYEQAIGEIIKLCKGLPKRILIWAMKLMFLTPEEVLNLSASQLNMEPVDNVIDEFGEFPMVSLSRRSTVHEYDLPIIRNS